MKAYNPIMLWLFLLIPPMLVLIIYAYLKGREGLRRLGGAWRFEALFNVYLVKTFFGHLCFFLFFTFAVLSLADYRWGDRLVEDDRSGYEVVFLIDISRSMLAQDAEPSRLGAAVSVVKDFADRSRNTRFGVVVFKGEAYSPLPITEDINAVEIIVDNLTTDMMTAPGSNIEKGIRTALEAFQSAGRYRTILLFSDGEALEGDGAMAAREASKRGIPIIPVATGTAEGEEIILSDGSRVKDQNGRPVVSRLNREALTDIARLSGGRVYSLEEAGRIRPEMLSILKSLDVAEVEPGLRLVKKQFYGLFLLLSLFFLTLSQLIRGLRWKKLI